MVFCENFYVQLENSMAWLNVLGWLLRAPMRANNKYQQGSSCQGLQELSWKEMTLLLLKCLFNVQRPVLQVFTTEYNLLNAYQQANKEEHK